MFPPTNQRQQEGITERSEKESSRRFRFHRTRSRRTLPQKDKRAQFQPIHYAIYSVAARFRRGCSIVGAGELSLRFGLTPRPEVLRFSLNVTCFVRLLPSL
jgi:hypothetical protein